MTIENRTPTFLSAAMELYTLGLKLQAWSAHADGGTQYRLSFLPGFLTFEVGDFYTFDLSEALRVGRQMSEAYRSDNS
jgi:hypothetical protein